MRVLLFLLFCCICFTTNAQPGTRTIEKNINDFTPGEIDSSKSPYGNECRYILDKTTDLLKLKNLHALHKIVLIAKVEALPKELDCLSDSLTQMIILADYILKDISSLRKIKNLKKIDLYCEGKNSLKLNKQDSLASLHLGYGGLNNINGIQKCGYINDLVLYELNENKLDFDKLSIMNVEKLKLSECNKLTDIDGIGKWKSLRDLDLTLLPAIKKIDFDDLAELDLRSLRFYLLKSLGNLDMISRCQSLKELYINYGLNSMTSLNFDLGKMNLEKLAIGGIINLRNISDIANLKSLKELNIYGLDSLKTIDFDMSKTKLETAKIEGCQFLKTINGIENCRSLKMLDLWQLNSVETLDFGKTKKLESLKMNALGCLKNISGLDHCKSLKEIYIINSAELASITDLKKLSFVKSITLSANKKLRLTDTYKKNSNWRISQPQN